jgi:hypothetical protein
MSPELIDAIERAQRELAMLGHLLRAIAETNSIEQAQALAAIGEEHAAMRASWLQDVIDSEATKAGRGRKG